MNLINCSFLIYFAQQSATILIICSSLAIIFSNLIQKTASHYFFNIIPNYYILCRIQGNVLINVISTVGRIVSCALLVAYETNQDEEIVDELEVVTPNLKTPVRNLSGGNIQKLLVGREISSSPKVLMVAYPVRGLDIKSSYTIYDLQNKKKERGTAVVFVGEDLDVLIALSDRILVLSGGKVAGIVDARKTTKEEIGLLMTKSIEKQEVLYDVNAEDEEE